MSLPIPYLLFVIRCVLIELKAERIPSLEKGWRQAEEVSAGPPALYSTLRLTNLTHQASEPLDKEPHLLSSHPLPLLQVCTCGGQALGDY